MPSRAATPELPSALEEFAGLAARLADARPAVFLDYDGTLTPIVDRPEDAVIGSEMQQALRRLGSFCPVAVISGRACEDVRALVGIGNIHYAGNHGFEIRGAEGSGIHEERGGEYLDEVAAVGEALRPVVEAVPGAIIEDKRYSLSLHYRLADPSRVPELERAVDRELAARPALRKHHGKMVFEIRPRIEWDKGRAVLWLLDALGLDDPAVVPLYLGDDVTDEDAFRALRDRGVGILVTDAPRDTLATYVLADPAEVRRFLGLLAGALEARA